MDETRLDTGDNMAEEVRRFLESRRSQCPTRRKARGGLIGAESLRPHRGGPGRGKCRRRDGRGHGRYSRVKLAGKRERENPAPEGSGKCLTASSNAFLLHSRFLSRRGAEFQIFARSCVFLERVANCAIDLAFLDMSKHLCPREKQIVCIPMCTVSAVEIVHAS